MQEKNTCVYCIYYGPHSQDPKVPDYWCFRHDFRVINKTPKCDYFKLNEGGENFVNAPYLGFFERQKDRQKEGRKEGRINLCISGFFVIIGVVIGVVLTIIIN